jgi:ribose transport system ATP-binding protein
VRGERSLTEHVAGPLCPVKAQEVGPVCTPHKSHQSYRSHPLHHPTAYLESRHAPGSTTFHLSLFTFHVSLRMPIPPPAVPLPNPFLRLEHITKRYGGVTALSNVDFACSLGTIHAVVGENGAGKSSLMKLIAGVTRPDEGEIYVEDKPIKFASPSEAAALGIVCIFQELSLLPDLSVADNISIADPPKRLGLIDRPRQRRIAEEVLHRVGCGDIHPDERVKDLPLSRQQMVEIAKALIRNPRLIIMDEATSALTARDVEHLYRIVRGLREQGVAVLYISHRMPEISALADICSVFRNGKHIETFPMSSRTTEEIVPMMIGREVARAYPEKPTAPTPSTPSTPSTKSTLVHSDADTPTRLSAPLLEIKDLTWYHVLNGISLKLAPGEIVGLGGLDGQGQSELLLALFGVLRGLSGEVYIDGRPTTIEHPRQAKSRDIGLALIPQDRQTQGLLLPMSIEDNLVLAASPDFSRFGLIDRAREQTATNDIVAKLRILANNLSAPVRTLSGGNQQKVVIGKWLLKQPRILLLNDPTRGIDVGTKQELYRLMRELAGTGLGILFYSTDYEELIGMCDRVLVCYGGRLIRELSGPDLNEHNLITTSLNLAENNDPKGSPPNDPWSAASLARPTRSETPTAPAHTPGTAPPTTSASDSFASIRDPIRVHSRSPSWSRFWKRNAGPLLSFLVFAVMFILFASQQANGLSTNVLTSVSNKGVVLAFVALAQTLVILTGGFDLSVGMVMTMSSCLSSVILNGSPGQTALAAIAILLSGLVAGAINATIVVIGRIQPIIATLATGAIYFGIALLLRPSPGGEVNEDLSNALTYDVFGIPTTFLLLVGTILFVWWPFRNLVVGRNCYAVGSSERAAYMSGLAIGRARFAAYALAGLLAACGGLLLSLISLSGEASSSQGGFYTLNSIAAVAIGGTSLFGGSGGFIGSIFGALVLRTISDLLFVFNAPALWQPLFQGLILLGAVCLGAVRVLRRKNQMDVFL